MSDRAQLRSETLVFGEVLFDRFADGSRVLGGAPFNVAWHLQGFGGRPLFVSAVGADEPGREVLDRMGAWGMRTDGLQVDGDHPTGRVTASIVDGEPVFDIDADQAYDHVSQTQAITALGDTEVGLLYHGTLALREARSAETLDGIRRAAGAPTFVDLNLRAPWWTPERVDSCLDSATWLKLNRDELATVTGRIAESAEACEDSALSLARERGLDALIVTMGEHGSLMVRDGCAWKSDSATLDPREVVDTVGAGDAFSAVACIGLVGGWESGEILRRGDAFAAELCRVRGATLQDRSLYDWHLGQWGS